MGALAAVGVLRVKMRSFQGSLGTLTIMMSLKTVLRIKSGPLQASPALRVLAVKG